jgi:hypothetical protein
VYPRQQRIVCLRDALVSLLSLVAADSHRRRKLSHGLPLERAHIRVVTNPDDLRVAIAQVSRADREASSDRILAGRQPAGGGVAEDTASNADTVVCNSAQPPHATTTYGQVSFSGFSVIP